MIQITNNASHKPGASQALAGALASRKDLNGYLYFGFPIFRTEDGRLAIDALLLSPEKGAVIFRFIEGADAGEIATYAEAQDEAARLFISRLAQTKELWRGRNLLADVRPVTFAPVMHASDGTQADYPLVSVETLHTYLDSYSWKHGELYPYLLAAIQMPPTRRDRPPRPTKHEGSRGSIANALDRSMSSLDETQNAAIFETYEGVQRIRGLAGSGKTVVLARKAAYLHDQHPDWDIAVTFNTRALKGQFERLITDYFRRQSDEPNWEKLWILNAWGSSGSASDHGLYYLFCQENDVPWLAFKEAFAQFGRDAAFTGACELALEQATERRPLFDAILVDEAQDFAPPFLNLCYELLRGEKRLVYAYDELQNLSNKGLPPPEELFGNDSEGKPRVTFSAPQEGMPKQDLILSTCYRNSRPILVTAHALGFGLYRGHGNGLIQMFSQKNLWRDVGYEVEEGAMEDGQRVRLVRPAKTSPRFLEEHSPIADLLLFRGFSSAREQSDWLVEAIRKNIEEEELRPEDIIVINPDPLTTKGEMGLPRSLLTRMGINNNLAGVSASRDVFFHPGEVTFTGVNRAKGNEASMVYVINAQDCVYAPRPATLARVRNRLFTSITRSKAWVRVLGVGPSMQKLEAEFGRVKDSDFTLDFVYPTPDELAMLTIVNRDQSRQERKEQERREQTFEEVLRSLETGESFLEDYPPEMVERLQRIFDTRRRS